jgi:hypothetical protein
MSVLNEVWGIGEASVKRECEASKSNEHDSTQFDTPNTDDRCTVHRVTLIGIIYHILIKMKVPIANATIFVLSALSRICVVEPFTIFSRGSTGHPGTKLCYNIYDEWRSDSVIIDTLPLDEENVQMCLDELIYSDFGQTMFGIHDAPGTFLYGLIY